MGRLIDRFGTFKRRQTLGPYASVIRSIMYQQLAGPAATAILKRFLALYGEDGRMPEPGEILTTTEEQFRAAGVSRQKAGYLRDLALHVTEDRIDFETID